RPPMRLTRTSDSGAPERSVTVIVPVTLGTGLAVRARCAASEGAEISRGSIAISASFMIPIVLQMARTCTEARFLRCVGPQPRTRAPRAPIRTRPHEARRGERHPVGLGLGKIFFLPDVPLKSFSPQKASTL